MKQIPAKVYYEVATGNILVTTSEMYGTITETTKEQDIEMHTQLQGRNIDEIDFIELEYGTLATTFNNAKSYSINLNTKKLEVVYYTEDELNAMQQQNQETQALNDRVSDISSYLQNQTDLISIVENSIIQAELNAIS